MAPSRTRGAAVVVAAVVALAACGGPPNATPGSPGAARSGVASVSMSASPTPGATVRSVATGAASPSAGSLACHAGNRAAAGTAQLFRAVPNAGREVALTFDMGGRLDPAVEIMRFLVANRVCATIFATGAMSETAAGQEVLAIVALHPDLFEIGNHTMHHCDLVSGGGGSPTTAPCAAPGVPSADFVRRELTDAAAILQQATGQGPAPYWRPPYGSTSPAVLAAAASVGYTKTFLWDIDTVDWKPASDGGPTAEQVAAKVTTAATPGSVVLMHLGGYVTLAALGRIVPALRERGLRLTSLSDLLDG